MFVLTNQNAAVLLLHLEAPLAAPAFHVKLYGRAVAETITVNRRGGGDFRTVQAVADFVPDGNRKWIRIHVRKGTTERRLPFRRINTTSCWKGIAVSFGAHAHAGIGHMLRRRRRRNVATWTTFHSTTFTILADYFIACDIAFKSTYDGRRPEQAVAALVGGDKIAFYGCAFHGFQDTLCDFTGRHYFRRCAIAGGIDFIFGYDQSIYDGWDVTSTMPPGRQPGWVTAHARAGTGAPSGLIFRGGSVDGTGRQYLGRAWNRFAIVVFYRTDMPGVVGLQGW